MPLLRFIPETTNVDFVKYRFVAFAIDGLLMLVSVISIVWHGFNLGIDFTGGVLMEVKSAQVIDVGKMRSDIIGLGFNDPVVQTFGGVGCDQPAGSCAMIRVQPKAAVAGADQNEADQASVRAIKNKLGSGYEYRRTEVVGPKVSGELLSDGILATILAVAMISVYVAVRFEWQYGVGALIATGHDVFVTAGFFSVLQLDFNINTVASLLLLAGYSINDTVVVFDRIRENRFSVAILFGIVVGTFSSTYVAAALLLYLPAVGGKAEIKAEQTPA
jgi:preprotein translocase subunit SecF